MGKILNRSNLAVAIACIVLLCSCDYRLTNKKPSIVQTDDGKNFVDVSDKDEPELITVQAETSKKERTVQDIRMEVQAVYKSQVGVREKTGNNDGKDVEKYLKAVGLGKGFAWCAAFVKWCFDQVGVITTITAWSPTAENKQDLVYSKGKLLRQPQTADVLTIYYKNKGRIGHTGFFDHMVDDDLVASYEGNTNGKKSNEGDGVYLVFRPLGTINSISTWIH